MKIEMKNLRELIVKNNYKKQLKEVSKYPDYNEELLKKYVQMLRNNEKLPEKAKDHKLSKHSPGIYSGCRDFHLAPDIVVVYRLTSDALELVAIGKHNKLQLTSSWNYFGYYS